MRKHPYELWTTRQLKLRYFRVFVCKAFEYASKNKRKKLENKELLKEHRWDRTKSPEDTEYTWEEMKLTSREL